MLRERDWSNRVSKLFLLNQKKRRKKGGGDIVKAAYAPQNEEKNIVFHLMNLIFLLPVGLSK